MKACMPVAVVLLGLVLTACAAKQPVAADGNGAVAAESAARTENAVAPARADVAATQDAVPGGATSVASADGSYNLDDYGDDFSLDDYDDSPAVEVWDPFQPWNRFWFRFNDVLLLKVLKPVHTGYTKVMPGPLRSGIANFAHNLASPVRMLNSLLQGKFTQAGVEFGRFCINTMTSLGLADVASQSKPLYPYHPETENFGHTLLVWGVPEGPYLVWPFLGPSTARGTVGTVGDLFAAPESYMLSWPVSLAKSTGFTFNNLDRVYMPYEKVTDASLEPYIAVRNGYLTLLRKIPR